MQATRIDRAETSRQPQSEEFKSTSQIIESPKNQGSGSAKKNERSLKYSEYEHVELDDISLEEKKEVSPIKVPGKAPSALVEARLSKNQMKKLVN